MSNAERNTAAQPRGPQTTAGSLRTAGRFCKPYALTIVIMVSLLIVSSGLAVLPPLYARALIDGAIPAHDMRGVWFNVGEMVAAALLAAAASVQQGRLNARIAEGIVRDVGVALIERMYSVPFAFYVEHKTGEVMNRVNGDVDALRGVLVQSLSPIISCIVGLVATAIAIGLLNRWLIVVALVLTAGLVVPLTSLSRHVGRVQQSIQEVYDEIGAMTQETFSISGIMVVKSFTREPWEERRFYDVSTRLMALRIRQVLATQWFYGSVGVFAVAVPALVWLAGGWLIISGTLRVGVIIAFIAYLSQFYGYAAGLTSVHLHLVAALRLWGRISAYLHLESEPSGGNEALGPWPLSFNDVHFTYPSGDRGIDGVTFSIEPGQTAAFVGASGAGKSTIAQLIMRFYDPQQGSIRLGGQDVRDVSLRSLREQIGIVPQETYLFHDTVAANLRYAMAGCSESEMHAAARAANIHEAILALPAGYDTMVGARGHALSGGERQRIALARMFLKKPQLLVMDEATSALDSANELAVHEAAMRLVGSRTCVLLAHRLSTVMHADVIFVLEAGKIVEQGKHADLVVAGGPYARLFAVDLELSRAALSARRSPAAPLLTGQFDS